MWLLKDLKIRTSFVKTNQSIPKILICLLITIIFVLVNIPNIIVVNYAYLFLFIVIVQPFMENDIHIWRIYKIYYSRKYIIYYYMQLIIICSMLIPFEVLIGECIFYIFLRLLVYASYFSLLTIFNLNKYTNLILVFMITEFLSKLMLK